MEEPYSDNSESESGLNIDWESLLQPEGHEVACEQIFHEFKKLQEELCLQYNGDPKKLLGEIIVVTSSTQQKIDVHCRTSIKYEGDVTKVTKEINLGREIYLSNQEQVTKYENEILDGYCFVSIAYHSPTEEIDLAIRSQIVRLIDRLKYSITSDVRLAIQENPRLPLSTDRNRPYSGFYKINIFLKGSKRDLSTL